MTVTPSVIYLIGILDRFHFIIGIIIIFLLIFLSLFAILYLVNHSQPLFADDLKAIQKLVPLARKGLFTLAFLLLLKIFVPSTGLLASMYIIPAVVNNEKVQNISTNLLGTLESLSQKWMVDVLSDIGMKNDQKKPSNENK